MRRILSVFAGLAALILTAGVARGADGWVQLKLGMTSNETMKFLGEPLMRTKARGIERWIYDGGGETVFMGGPLISWTVASPTPESEARSIEYDVLMRSPHARPPSTWTPRTPVAAPTSTYEREMAVAGSH